jgi:hypothetical protein
MSTEEKAVRNILGCDWDSSYHPSPPDRFNHPLSITAVADEYDNAETFVLSLVGTPCRGKAILIEWGRAGYLSPSLDYLDDGEVAILRSFVETVLGSIRFISVGTFWMSHIRGKPVPFPSGLSWADLRV